MSEHRIIVVGRPFERLDPLRQQLEADGFLVVASASLEDAQDAALLHRPDMLFLRPLGPAGVLDGLAVCRGIRRTLDDPQLPVIVVNDAENSIDAATALEHGADEVISASYEPRELFARLRALLRRNAGAARRFGVVTAGSIELDLDRYAASIGGRPISLTPKEFELLRELIEARGRVVRRDAVLERVWQYGRRSGIESRTLDVHIRRLRKKLGDEGSRIVTVRNVGYRMDISPVWVTPRRRANG
jgi:DNA-binding response OmpR family regulator